MLTYRFCTVWGAAGILIGLLAFLYNYTMIPQALLGYTILVAPAILTLSFFNEEIAFVPKMILFLLGQFVGYFFIAFIVQAINKRFNCYNRN